MMASRSRRQGRTSEGDAGGRRSVLFFATLFFATLFFATSLFATDQPEKGNPMDSTDITVDYRSRRTIGMRTPIVRQFAR